MDDLKEKRLEKQLDAVSDFGAALVNGLESTIGAKLETFNRSELDRLIESAGIVTSAPIFDAVHMSLTHVTRLLRRQFDAEMSFPEVIERILKLWKAHANPTTETDFKAIWDGVGSCECEDPNCVRGLYTRADISRWLVFLNDEIETILDETGDRDEAIKLLIQVTCRLLESLDP